MTRIELPEPPRRILIVKPSALGDVVHTLPILRLLRKRWPEARYTWLVASAFAGLLDGHPDLDSTILFDRNRLARSWRDPSAARRLFEFVRTLKNERFDLVIDFQGLHRSGWLTGLTFAPVRVGFASAREWAHAFYTHPVEGRGEGARHAIERYLDIAEALGCDRGPVEFRFHYGPDDAAHVDRLVSGIGKFAVLLPGTNWLTKRWPTAHFAALAPRLRESFGLATVVAGGPDAAELARHIPADLNAVGQTSLKQLVALLERASLVVANDSGPMHIAAALGRPLVTMFGPTHPTRTGPYARPETVARVDIPCSPCYSRKCSHTSCMKWLEVEHVLEVAANQLKDYSAITR